MITEQKGKSFEGRVFGRSYEVKTVWAKVAAKVDPLISLSMALNSEQQNGN